MLKLSYDGPLSKFAFKLSLRHYTVDLQFSGASFSFGGGRQRLTIVYFSAQRKRFLWDWGYIQGLVRGWVGGLDR